MEWQMLTFILFPVSIAWDILSCI